MTRPTEQLWAQLAGWEAAHRRWRGSETLNLNAATNSLSEVARSALATSMADKGISSGRHSRHHMGGQYLDLIEEQLEQVALDLFGAAAVDLRPPSGSVANAIAIAALVPRDAVLMAGDAATLGHYSYRNEGWGGRLAAAVLRLPFQADGMTLDLDATADAVRRQRPAMIFVGAQAMLFPLDLAALRAIADEVAAVVVYDAAHPLGLIAGGQFQDPLAEGADLITASTQKSLPGPVGGIILARSTDLMSPIYQASNHLLSNYQNNRVLSVGYTLLEMSRYGADYAAACVRNAQALGAALAEAGLAPLFGERGFTRSNQLLIDWDTKESADAFAVRCEQANVIVSTIRLPAGDDRLRFGTRLGTQDLTRHGFGVGEFGEIAELLASIGSGGPIEPARRRVTELAQDHQLIHYSFDAA
jgi:glycine hydroxymethyltransferase